MLVGSAVKATGNALELSLRPLAAYSPVPVQRLARATGLADVGGKVFDKLGIDTTLEPEQLHGDVVTALKEVVFRHCSLNSCSNS